MESADQKSPKIVGSDLSKFVPFRTTLEMEKSYFNVFETHWPEHIGKLIFLRARRIEEN